MALGTISGSNLVSQVWQNLFEIIDTNVTDPKSRVKSMVYSAFPMSRKGTEDTFPCIIIESPDLTAEQFVLGSAKRYTWTIPVSIYNTNMATLDSVSDEVLKELETNKGSLNPLGLFQINYLSAPTTHTVIDRQVVHEKRIDVQLEGVI